MEEKYVGIDIPRDYGVACVQDIEGKIVDEFRFGNKLEKIKKIDLTNGETIVSELTKKQKDILDCMGLCA